MNNKLASFRLNNSGDKRIFLFQHGETNWNAQKRVKGSEDVDTVFTDKGMKQIAELAKSLGEKKIEVIFASDIKRARDSAIIANKNLNLPLFFHEELRAWDIGKFIGLSVEDFVNNAEVIESFKNYDKPIPGGESINQLIARLVAFIKKVTASSRYKNIGMVTHSSTISNINMAISENEYVDVASCELLFSDGKLKVIGSQKIGIESGN